MALIIKFGLYVSYKKTKLCKITSKFLSMLLTYHYNQYNFIKIIFLNTQWRNLKKVIYHNLTQAKQYYSLYFFFIYMWIVNFTFGVQKPIWYVIYINYINLFLAIWNAQIYQNSHLLHFQQKAFPHIKIKILKSFPLSPIAKPSLPLLWLAIDHRRLSPCLFRYLRHVSLKNLLNSLLMSSS